MMYRSDIKYLHFPLRYLKISAFLLLLFCILIPFSAFAQEGYNVNGGYACPGMNVLKERYQGDCFPCEIVNVLLASFMRAASKVYDVSKEAGNKLLLLGSALWLAFWALQKVSSLANEEPSTMTNELIIFFGKVLVAYCFINSGIGTLVSYAINPILGAGAEFGSAMLLETENIDISSDPAAENQYSGPTDIVSKPVMDKILKLSEGVSNEVATNLIIGSGLTCFSIQNGLHIYVPGIIEINIPDIWLWLCGAAIWCAGFMMVLSVCYYLIDIPFKIGFAIIALPVVIGLWPFKMTSDKLKSVVEIALNAAFTFLFLALSASYAIRLISEAFSAEGDLDVNGQTYSGKEALFKAFEVDNVEYVESLFDFTGPAFLIILFCYIYGIKMISSITNDYPGKFASGMTSAAGSPLHHMATAATMWATNKISAPFKTAAQIVAHQAGKAATTATKAAANVGIGAAGAAFGATNKFVGRGINKATAGWVNRQKNLKAAADSLDNYNKMHNAGTATKLQGKLGKISASVGLGLAKSVNKLGKGLEKSGDIMMSPGRDTFSRIASAAKEGGAEIKDAGINLGGALKENVAAFAPNKLIKVMKRSPKLGKLADSLMERKDAMRISAHQDFNKSVKGLTNASSTLAQSATNTFNKSKRGLTNAFSKAKNLHENIKSGAAADKLAALSKKSIKYVTSGSFLKPVGKYYADQYKRTQQDISRSKQNIRGLNTIGQSFKDRISLAGTDLKEAAQSLSPQAFKRNVVNSVNDLRETVDDFRIATERETGLQSNAANTVANLTGISLGIATARNLGRNIRSGVGYVAEGPRNGIAETLGTGVVRPAVALGMTIADTATQTLDSAYNLSEGALLTGISIAQTVTAPVKNIASSLTYGAYAIGDSSLALASVAGDTIGVVASRLNVAYQYTKYVTRPLAGTLVGAPLKGVGKTLGFAAKTVDNTLYTGYKAAESLTKGTMQAGNVLVQGANVLYHGVKDRTVVGQAVSKTLKSGSKTLSLAAKTLKLGKNVIKAAAGEEFDGMDNRKSSKQAGKNKYQDKKEQERREQERKEQERQEQERQEQERKEQEEREREKEEQERKEPEEKEREKEEQERKERERKEKEEKERKDWLLEKIGNFDTTFGNSDNDWYLIGLASTASQIKTADNKFIREASNRIAEIPPKIFEDKVYDYYDLIDKGEIGLHEALRVKKFAQDYLAQNMDPDQYNELIQETNRFILQSRKDLNMGVIFEKEGKEVLICKDHDIVDNYTPSEFTSQLGIENLVGLDIQITDKDQVSRFKLTDDMGGCELTIKPKDSKSIDNTIIYSYHDGNYYKSVNYSYEEIIPKGSSEYDLVKSEIENAQHEAIDVFSEFKIGMHDKAIVDSIWGSQAAKEKQKNNRVLDQMKKENQESYDQRRKKHQETIDRIRNGEHVDIEKEYQEEFQQDMEDIATIIEKINKFN